MRKFVLVVLLVALCTLVGGVSAQAETYCGELSADDCAILQASAEAMAGLTSATATFSLDFSMVGVPDAPGDITLNLAGDATWSGDPEALAGMAEPSPEMMQDPAAMMAMAGEALGALNAELNLSLTVPAEMAAGMGGFPEQIDLQLRLVEGIGYVNFDTLAPLLAGSPQGEMLQGWGGLNLVEALTTMGPMLSGGMMGEMPEMPEMGTDGGEMSMEGINITRGADEDGAAVFTTTLDTAAILGNPVFQQQFRSQMQSQGQMTDEEIDALLTALAETPDAITLTSSTWIDQETNYNLGGTFEMTIALDAFASMAGEDSAAAAEALGDSVITISGELAYDNFDAAPAVEAPADATIITMEQFFNFLFTGELTPQS